MTLKFFKAAIILFVSLILWTAFGQAYSYSGEVDRWGRGGGLVGAESESSKESVILCLWFRI